MTRNEAQTRFDLIDPALRSRGWLHPTHAYPAIRVEERDPAIEIIDGKARRRATKPKDYVLYWDCAGGTTPQPIAILEAKREGQPPDYGLEQGIVSLPAGVFLSAGAGVKTNLVFFTKGRPTERIWYFDR